MITNAVPQPSDPLPTAKHMLPPLKYENRRADYLKDWWTVANWEEAAQRYERSEHSTKDKRDAECAPLLEAAA